MFRWAITEVLPAIEAPMLALCGTRDIVTLPSASETIVRLAPRARMMSIPGCGHMGFLENAAAYNQAIAAFAQEVFAGAPATLPAQPQGAATEGPGGGLLRRPRELPSASLEAGAGGRARPLGEAQDRLGHLGWRAVMNHVTRARHDEKGAAGDLSRQSLRLEPSD